MFSYGTTILKHSFWRILAHFAFFALVDKLFPPGTDSIMRNFMMVRELVLVLALAAVVLGHSLEKRSPGPCERILRCFNGVDMTQFTEIDDTLSDAEALDQICSGMDQVIECIADSQGECSDITANEEVQSVLQVATYICSDEGKQHILSLADSPCATDELKGLELQVALHGCQEEFQTDAYEFIMNSQMIKKKFVKSDMCPFVDNLKTCMTRESTDICGADFGDFVSTIWDIAASQQYDALGCSSDIYYYLNHNRRMVTRAIPMVLKRSAFLAQRRR